MVACRFALCIVAVLVLGTARCDVVPKNLAGPPSEFADFGLPSALHNTIVSRSMLLRASTKSGFEEDLRFPGNMTVGSEGWEWTTEFPVDQAGVVVATLVTPLADADIELRCPDGARVFRANYSEKIGIDASSFPAVTAFGEVVAEDEGNWTVTVRGKSVTSGALPEAYILIGLQDSPRNVHVTIGSYMELHAGKNLTILATVDDPARMELAEIAKRPGATLPARFATNAVGSVDMAVTYVTDPSGRTTTVHMHDDGLQGDGFANDELFGGAVELVEPGLYAAETLVSGTTPEGEPFSRTINHLVRAVNPSLDLKTTGTVHDIGVTKGVDGPVRRYELAVNVAYDAKTCESEGRYRGYAQVWGTSKSTGSSVPVAWVGGVANVKQSTDGDATFSFLLDARWLDAAEATFPLELREVFVQTVVGGWNPMSSQDTVKLSAGKGVSLASVRDRHAPTGLPRPGSAAEREMREGVRPSSLLARAAATRGGANGDGAIVLVHGYCSSETPFPKEHFTNSFAFRDFNKDRSHDEFARLIAEQTSHLPAYAIAAHSQGGMASLHLASFYHSGLDMANGDMSRLIQSVGTPYGGCPLAGLLAEVGKIFSVGCGPQEDLTHDGAKLWLATVPPDARARVSFYTAQYATSGPLWDHFCNIAANSVLSWPNDGVTELKFASLEGGNSVGNTKGECHSVNMHFEPECKDPERNAEINAKAPR